MKKGSNPHPPLEYGDRPEPPVSPPSLRDKYELMLAQGERIKELTDRVLELENVLRYYGDSDNYELHYSSECTGGVANVEYDAGRRARKLLHGEDNESKS